MIYPEFSEYKTINNSLGESFKNLAEKNKQKLLNAGINVNKVRFTFIPMFVYDFVDDEISPKTDIKFPMMSDGKFDTSKKPIFLVDKRNDRMYICVSSYKEKISNIKDDINSSDRGYVFLLQEYQCEVDSEVIRYAKLDDVIRNMNIKKK